MRAWTWTIAVGPECIAGRYAVGTAPEFGSCASAHLLRVVRLGLSLVTLTGIRLLLVPSFGWIQSEHVQQNRRHIRHHDEGNEHDEPGENGEATNAKLVQQNGENNHHNDFQKSAVLLPPK